MENSSKRSAVQIAGVEIISDGEGRFSLNSLHRASGGEKKHGPSYWLALESTQDLIAELRTQTTEIPVVSLEGRNGGTFAHELLVVSYAGWVSPAFQLKVNQAFLDMKAANQPRMLTTTETLIQMLQLQADVERRQAETEKAVNRLEHRIDEVASTTAFPARPAASESITHIRERIGRDYGLSASVIDEVMRQMPYAPKPAGMVKNDHANADGSHYAVYWKKDITKTFDRFMSECVPATQFMHTHPFLEGRFRVARKSLVRA